MVFEHEGVRRVHTAQAAEELDKLLIIAAARAGRGVSPMEYHNSIMRSVYPKYKQVREAYRIQGFDRELEHIVEMPRLIYTPFRELSEMTASQKEGLSERVRGAKNLLVLVHPGYSTAGSLRLRAQQDPARATKAHLEHIRMTEEKEAEFHRALKTILKRRKGPIAIFEEDGSVGHTSLDLESLGVDPKDDRVFFVRTRPDSSDPLMGWDGLLKEFKGLDVRRVIIGGQRLTFGKSEEEPLDIIDLSDPLGELGHAQASKERGVRKQREASGALQRTREAQAALERDLEGIERSGRPFSREKLARKRAEAQWVPRRCVGEAMTRFRLSGFKTTTVPKLLMPQRRPQI